MKSFRSNKFSWIVLSLYFQLICVGTFHFHSQNLSLEKTIPSLKASSVNQFIDPYSNSSGICSVEQFFNHNFFSNFINYFHIDYNPESIEKFVLPQLIFASYQDKLSIDFRAPPSFYLM